MSSTNAHRKKYQHSADPDRRIPDTDVANDAGSDEPGNPGHLPPETDPFCADNYPSPTDQAEIDGIE